MSERETARCPLCGARLVVADTFAVGDVLACRGCRGMLVLSDTTPPALDVAWVEWLSSRALLPPQRPRSSD
ncbi:hypothetical protein ARMA_0720 [Ardenticatena maritima]|uniref:Uncharacterized protein n=1 Tax=Ardenticatena maritima TaxID=872965 RepID=A0A0M9UBZ8_9CHLR|nr:hypothetical protein [Ardenticatena maritima]KPL87790.1 hypothetical protein SE16_09495 [Ardenticatena maritima]GAP62297.1 hypothetical protein ARMA_0720 [Ardenticatena maritima]